VALITCSTALGGSHLLPSGTDATAYSTHAILNDGIDPPLTHEELGSLLESSQVLKFANGTVPLQGIVSGSLEMIY